MKLFYHAATILRLGTVTHVPVPLNTSGVQFVDFASSAVVTRAALETYLKMYEVFFAPVSEDAHEFRYNQWKLAGFAIHEKVSPTDILSEVRLAISQRLNEGYRERIRNTGKFSQLGKGGKKVLQGKPIEETFKNRLEDSGLRSSWFWKAYEYVSGYAHSDALSANQVASASSQDANNYIEMHKGITMMIIARMIVEYLNKYPDVQAVAQARPQALGLSNQLSMLTTKDSSG